MIDSVLEKDYLTIDDVDVSGKTVLVRVDFNSPMSPDGDILDTKRIRSHIATMNDLSSAKVVVLAHQSRAGKSDFSTMEVHAKMLGKLSGKKVDYVDDIFGSNAINAIRSMKNGDILMLENVRFYSEESIKRSAHEHSQTNMVKKLAPYIDIFVNDAFGVSHRPHLSIMGFTQVIPSIAGRLMEKEIESLSKAGYNGNHPCIFVLGGTKVDDSFKVVKNVLANGSADKVLATGVVANVLLAADGVDIGKANMDFIDSQGYMDQIVVAQGLLEQYGDKIELPTDLALANDNDRVEISIDELPTDYPIYDIGLETIVSYSKSIREAKVVILNGPAGLFEQSEFELGTSEILYAATDSAFSIVGGGHIASALEPMGIENKISHTSTGGGACISFLAGDKLPGIEALKDYKKKNMAIT